MKKEILCFTPKKVVNVLIGALCHRVEEVRWKAIACIGPVVAAIAEENMESARVIIRRFMWMLNEESGGMAWGVPEAMAEALANHRQLAEEYTSILISYIWLEGNLLEYPPAQRGVIWGIGRLAQVFSDLVAKFNGPTYALHLLDSEDLWVKTLACWAYIQMQEIIPRNLKEEICQKLANFSSQNFVILLYDGKALVKANSEDLRSRLTALLN
nr:DVU0298 family protein [Thermodesulfatator indicus]